MISNLFLMNYIYNVQYCQISKSHDNNDLLIHGDNSLRHYMLYRDKICDG